MFISNTANKIANCIDGRVRCVIVILYRQRCDGCELLPEEVNSASYVKIEHMNAGARQALSAAIANIMSYREIYCMSHLELQIIC